MSWRRGIVASVLALLPAAAHAQGVAREPLKRTPLPVAVRPVCEARPAPAPPTAAQRTRAREAAQRGQQAAILGDRTSAREQLRQAAQLNPTDPDLAYQLARAHEVAGATADAVGEYCRFLALAPSAPEAGEARDRVASLGRPGLGPEPAANAPFRAALAAYDAGRLVEAEGALDRALAASPRWADAYYDRAVVIAARGDRERARPDFQEYLRLKPEADDRAAVVARLDALRKGPPSPRQALALGLVLPGAGQFYTGRPVPGLLALGGAVGALAIGMQKQTRIVDVERQGTDPFGQTYTYIAREQVTDRPRAPLGVGAVAAILVGGAIEAQRYARREAAAGARRVSLRGTGGAVVVSVSVR